jgi:vacuolar protein-sorting-associated protein 4
MTETLRVATDLLAKAIAADNETRYEEAFSLYSSALERFISYLKDEKNEDVRRRVSGRVASYIARAETLRAELMQKKRKGKSPAEAGDDAGLRGALQGAILVEKPSVRWGDVAGLNEAKRTLREAVILPQRFPQFFHGDMRPWSGILLYGPPGTGKSYLAKAVATEANATFFSVSSSDLVSKWVGESQRLVRQLFEMARERAPSVIFIDEIDSLASTRSEGETASQLQLKTEFLVQMDGIKRGDEDARVLVLGATNTPWTLDPAMRRRFERRIYIPLPDQDAREELFRLSIGKIRNNLTDQDFRVLARESQGFSGADISVVVRSAMMEPLALAQRAEFFLVDEDGMHTPWPDPDLPPCHKCPMKLSTVSSESVLRCESCGAVRCSLYEIDGPMLKVPDVTAEDFRISLSKTNPSVAVKETSRFHEWTREFGQDG